MNELSNHIPNDSNIKKLSTHFTIDKARIDLDYEYRDYLIRHPTVINIRKAQLEQFITKINFLNRNIRKQKFITNTNINERTNSEDIIGNGLSLIDNMDDDIKRFNSINISESRYNKYDGEVSFVFYLKSRVPKNISIEDILEADIDDENFQEIVRLYKIARDEKNSDKIPNYIRDKVNRENISLEEYFENILKDIIRKANEEIEKDQTPPLHFEELILEIERSYSNILDCLEY